MKEDPATLAWVKEQIQSKNHELRKLAPGYLVLPLMVNDFIAKKRGNRWVHRVKFSTPFDFGQVKGVQLSEPAEPCPTNPSYMFRSVLLITDENKKTCLSFPYLYNVNVVEEPLVHWSFVNSEGKEYRHSCNERGASTVRVHFRTSRSRESSLEGRSSSLLDKPDRECGSILRSSPRVGDSSPTSTHFSSAAGFFAEGEDVSPTTLKNRRLMQLKTVASKKEKGVVKLSHAVASKLSIGKKEEKSKSCRYYDKEIERMEKAKEKQLQKEREEREKIAMKRRQMFFGKDCPSPAKIPAPVRFSNFYKIH